MRDHPIVENMERYGTPDGKPEERFFCPVCYKEAERIYFSRGSKKRSDIIGCENCIDYGDAYEVLK